MQCRVECELMHKDVRYDFDQAMCQITELLRFDYGAYLVKVTRYGITIHNTLDFKGNWSGSTLELDDEPQSVSMHVSSDYNEAWDKWSALR